MSYLQPGMEKVLSNAQQRFAGCPTTGPAGPTNFTSVPLNHGWEIYVIKPISFSYTAPLNNKIIIYWLFKKGTYMYVTALYHTSGPAINKADTEGVWERRRNKAEREREKWRGMKWLLNQWNLDLMRPLAARIREDIIQSSGGSYGSTTYEWFWYSVWTTDIKVDNWVLHFVSSISFELDWGYPWTIISV